MFDYARWLSCDFQVTAHTSDVHHDFSRIPVAQEVIGGVTVCRHKLFFPKLAKKSIMFQTPITPPVRTAPLLGDFLAAISAQNWADMLISKILS